MNDGLPAGAATLSPIKRALVEIRDLRARLARAEVAKPESIAIVGMGLRFPGGAHDADSFAELLWSGTDAISPIPEDRWPSMLFDSDPDAPGKMITRHGGFLDGVDRFDADFFGISPREAASMDPQQRLFLEIGWEALENAGQSPAALGGSRTGVYLGISNSDYGRALLAQPERIDAYAGTGGAYSIVPGRLSYFLGLQGPSIAIDTACSSSLVALHLACQALRLRECDLALAGGINLILAPEMNIGFSKARMMAPDGRCKTFDAAADGYVRGEGCGVVVLRRLSDAVARNDRILAVVRGSAVNQDGRSNGLTAPNGPAQEAVIRAALDAAGVPPEAISYVETHGTGTPLGDPIEVGALASVFGTMRESAAPLVLGSVKTNIGHLEAAAGIAGVIKVILSLQRGEIPPNLNFHSGNPRIDWDSLPITVPTVTRPWPPIGERRLAGVSSFGFSGCNAHTILEAPPRRDRAATALADRPLHILALSARERPSLTALAQRYVTEMPEDAVLADICHTANAGRTHFTERVAVIGDSARSLRNGLATFARGDATPAIASGSHDVNTRPQVAFLFTGQGAQYASMGLALYETAPVFREALDRCAEGLAPYMQPGLLDLLRLDPAATPIDRTSYAQPALFAVEYALATLWRSWGVEPCSVMGHSLGEYVAACVAGLLPLKDALRLVAERGRLTEALAADSTMAVVFGPEREISEEVSRSRGALSIAAYNGPEHFVLSGERRAMVEAVDRLQAAGLRVRQLRLSFGAHSRCIEPVLPEFRSALSHVEFGTPRIPVISNVTGAPAGPEICRPDYWLAHMRSPVRFADAVRALRAQGVTHMIEIGPHPVLLGMAAECLVSSQAALLPSLRRSSPAWLDLLESLQRLYVDGADIDWDGFDRGRVCHRISLPSYPFRRRRYWIEEMDNPPRRLPADWTRIHEAISRQAERGPLDLNPGSYPVKWDCLARLTAGHAIRTLRESGVFCRAGERLTLEQVAEAVGSKTTYQRLLRRWLNALAARGDLRAEAEAWVADAPLPDPELDALWAEADALLADNQPLLSYVRHCGNLLGRVLRGEENPLETLFPQGGFDMAEALYERSATMRYVNELAACTVTALCDAVPAHRPVRVLEVGAGTGGTTSALLSAVPAERTRYLFTDVTDAFLARARERFGAYGFVSFAQFDVDRDLAAQDWPPASADLVVAANVVHAAVDLRAALRRLREHLAPGGALVMIESTTHFAWFDMTTGLIEGWQHFADDLRDEQPLLSVSAWLDALRDAGFTTAAAWPQEDSSATCLGQHVIVARVSGQVAADAVLSGCIPAGGDRAAAPGPEVPDARAAVLEALPTERMDLLRDFARAQVMHVLRRPADDPPGWHDRLTDLGLDSLMAVQLRSRLGEGLGFPSALPATLMFDHPTIDRIAAFLLNRLLPPEPVTPAAAVSEELPRAAAIAAMTDEEVEAVLTERLERRNTPVRTNAFSSNL